VPTSPKKPKASALGTVPAVIDILGGPVTRTPEDAAASAKPPARKTATPKKPSGSKREPESYQASTIYFRNEDLDIITEIRYYLEKSRKFNGRIGKSMMVRAGLTLLAAALKKDETRTLKIMESAATSGGERD